MSAFEHGTTTGYRRHGCRCEECTEANAQECRARQKRRYSERVLQDGVLVHPEAKHGTVSAYKNWGCHCEPCSLVRLEYDTSRRRRVRALGGAA
jgi:hypothetical protein